MKMDWDDVRVFLALARAGSLTAAARSLRIEHTTVARRIAQLERALGLHLFDRLPRGWMLTSEGEQLAARAAQMEEQAHEFMREAADGVQLSGTVRLAASPSVGQEFLLPRLCAIHQRWSTITLELVVETRVAVLSRREADLALRIGRPQDPGLAARLLGTMAYGLYCGAGYTEGRSEADWRFIGYDDSLAHTPEHQWLESVRGSRGYALRANTLALQRDAVRMGMGLAVLPHFMAAGDARLERLPVAAGTPAREIWLVVHPDVRRSPRVRLIADLLVEVVGSGADVLAPSFG